MIPKIGISSAVDINFLMKCLKSNEIVQSRCVQLWRDTTSQVAFQPSNQEVRNLTHALRAFNFTGELCWSEPNNGVHFQRARVFRVSGEYKQENTLWNFVLGKKRSTSGVFNYRVVQIAGQKYLPNYTYIILYCLYWFSVKKQNCNYSEGLSQHHYKSIFHNARFILIFAW